MIYVIIGLIFRKVVNDAGYDRDINKLKLISFWPYYLFRGMTGMGK